VPTCLNSMPAKVASSEPKVAWRDALPNIEEILDGQYNGQNVTLEYIVSAKGTVSLTHALEIQNDKSGSYYKAYIDAQTGELVSVTDYVAHASVCVSSSSNSSLTMCSTPSYQLPASHFQMVSRRLSTPKILLLLLSDGIVAAVETLLLHRTSRSHSLAQTLIRRTAGTTSSPSRIKRVHLKPPPASISTLSMTTRSYLKLPAMSMPRARMRSSSSI